MAVRLAYETAVYLLYTGNTNPCYWNLRWSSAVSL